MKKYEYVTVTYANKKTSTAETMQHRQIIDEYAAKGYRYAGFIPVLIGPSGKILSVDLVFEIDAMAN
jgi:hypothetical protein